MKKVIIGALVGMIIFFAFESALWMSGVHNDFSKYHPKQDEMIQVLQNNITEDGLYMLPSVDPNTSNYTEAHHELMQSQVGKPWIMVFYHGSMSDMSASSMLGGAFHAFLICLIVALVLFHGAFSTFKSRFLASMAFSLFYIIQGPIGEMTWWEFPWHYVKAGIIDIFFGWLLVSVWLAYFVKKS